MHSGQTKSSSGSTRVRYHISCHKCGKQVQYADKCDKECQTGATLLLSGIEDGDFEKEPHFQFMQHAVEVSLKLDQNGKIPKSWILLDNQSTAVDVFYNSSLLKNIRKRKKEKAHGHTLQECRYD